MNNFYNYVKDLIKSEPSTAYIDLMDLKLIDKDFYNNMSIKYDIDLINFNKNISYSKSELPIDPQISINESIKYNFKLNNQLYLEYVINKEEKSLGEEENYYISNLFICSSVKNNGEIVKFLEHVNNYIKKINKI